jgi:signal transduction histidine kinase
LHRRAYLLYLAKGEADIAAIHGYLETAERELRRASAITNQTLRFYKQSTNAVNITAHELFESVLAIQQGRIVNSSVQVEFRERTLEPIKCFDGEIRQVLNNIIGNAIDAMLATGGRLLMRSRTGTNWVTGAKGTVLTIADNGAGIPREVQTRLFEAFYTTKGINGNGLGLWVSKEIIERHAGSLKVSSSTRSDHSGTVFRIFLPSDWISR